MTAAVEPSAQFSEFTSDEAADPLEARGGLTPFSLDALPVFRRSFEEAAIPLSDYSFANNIAWYARQHLLYARIEGCLCLLAVHDGALSMPLPPLGPVDRAVRALDACIDLMHRHNGPHVGFEVRCVHEALVDAFVSGAWWRQASTVVSDPPDYLYSTVELVELRGSAYKSKRNDINQLLRGHGDVRLDALRPEHRGEVAGLCERWMGQRGAAPEGLDELAVQEAQAILFAVDHMDTLGLTGLRLLVDGEVEAFIVGERLLPTVAHVLFEKSNRELRGAAQLIFREYCRSLVDCALVNTGDALGSDSLAQSKQSYRPLSFGRKFTIASLRG